MRRNVFFLILAAGMMAVSCTSDPLLDDTQSGINTPLDTRSIKGDYANANQLASNLMASFRNKVSRTSMVAYPDYYGGAYINDNDSLVILTVGENTDKSEFVQRCKGDGFKTLKCKYSFNELNGVVEQITSFVSNEENQSEVLDVQFNGAGISNSENKVIVQLSDISDTNIAKFKAKIVDSPAIRFEKSEPLQFHSEIKTGSPIANGFIGGVNSYGSVGYRARYNGMDGVVVSGHVMKNQGADLYLGETTTVIGRCQRLQIGGKVDAAFCSLNSGYTCGTMIYNTMYYLNSTTDYLTEGQTAHMSGKYNTSSGKVAMVNYTASGQMSGMQVSIGGCTVAYYNSQGGDSGGIVYSDDYDILGIHEAGGKINNKNVGVYVLADNINNALFLTPY